MNKLIAIALLLFPVVAWSQLLDWNQDYQLDDSTQVVFGIRSHGFNNSTALTARALNNVFYGGFIDEDQKKHMIDRADAINSSGSIWNSSLYYSQKIDSLHGAKKEGLSWFVNIAQRQENLVLFSDNALKLTLNGNKQFANQTVSLTPLEYNQFRYTQFQMGLTKNFENGNGLTFGASFLYGNTSQYITVDRLDLLISATGDRISTDAEIIMNETDRNNQGFMPYNGAGASFDLEGRFAVQLLSDSTNPGIFHFAISDIGFIQWHGNSVQTEVDTFYSYSGIRIENIFDPNSPTTGNPENLWDSVSTQTHKPYVLFTPSTLHFYLEQSYLKFQFVIGGAHRNKGFYYPYFYGKCGYQISSSIAISGQINYGGYGKLGGGVELQHEGKNHVLKLGSTNLEGFISPDKWGGQSIYVQLAAKL